MDWFIALCIIFIPTVLALVFFRIGYVNGFDAGKQKGYRDGHEAAIKKLVARKFAALEDLKDPWENA